MGVLGGVWHFVWVSFFVVVCGGVGFAFGVEVGGCSMQPKTK